MARGFTRRGRTVFRRRDGVIAIRRASRWRRALLLAAAGTVALAPLVFALAFTLPVGLLPIPPLALVLLLWVLLRGPGPTERGRAVPLRHGELL